MRKVFLLSLLLVVLSLVIPWLVVTLGPAQEPAVQPIPSVTASSHLPDTVQFLVVTTEVTTIFFGKIFILHGYFTNLYFRFVSDVYIAECFAVLQRIFIIRMMQRRCAADSEISDLSRLQQEFIQCFAICFVFRFFRTFTIIEVNLSFARKIL